MLKNKIVSIATALLIISNNLLLTVNASTEYTVTTVPDSVIEYSETTIPPQDTNLYVTRPPESYIPSSSDELYITTQNTDNITDNYIESTSIVDGTSVPDSTSTSSTTTSYNESLKTTAQYPTDWKNWTQTSELNEIPIGNSNACILGSPLIAIAKLLVQSNVIPSEEFNPYLYCKWVSENNIIPDTNTIDDWNTLLNYKPLDFTGDNYLLGKVLYKGSISHGVETLSLLGSKAGEPNVVTSSSETSSTTENSQTSSVSNEMEKYTTTTEALNLIKKYRDNGYGVIIKTLGSKYYLIGNTTTYNGAEDMEVYGSVSTDKKYLTEFGDNDILRIDIYASSISIDNKASNNPLENIENKEAEKSGSSESIYHLSNFNQTQKEALALVKNKFMTQNDITAMKWNMIVSQFVIPYHQNLDDVFENSAWKEVMDNINSLKYCLNGNDNTMFLDYVEEYLGTLQSKSKELKEVLNILKTDNVYSPIYNDTGQIATLKDMITGDALYIKDNYALNTISQNNISTNTLPTLIVDGSEATTETSVVFETTPETTTETSTDITGTSETSTTDSETPQIDNGSFKSLVSSFYEVLNGEKSAVYESILEASSVQEIMIPCYINTDSTVMYNNIFIFNARRFANSTVTVQEYISPFMSKELYLDRYGNICIKDKDTAEYNDMTSYTMVYPSYANPMYISSEIDKDTAAGVFYGDYNRMFSPVTITVDNNQTEEGFYINATVIKDYEEIKEFLNTSNITEDTYYGYYGLGNKGSFQSNQLLTRAGMPVDAVKYNRFNSDGGTTGLTFARIDTTTNCIGNKMMLTLLASRNILNKTLTSNGWYDSLRCYNPNSVDYELTYNNHDANNTVTEELTTSEPSETTTEVSTSVADTSETTITTAESISSESIETTATKEENRTKNNVSWNHDDYIANVIDVRSFSNTLNIEKQLIQIFYGRSTASNAITTNDVGISNGKFYVGESSFGYDGINIRTTIDPGTLYHKNIMTPFYAFGFSIPRSYLAQYEYLKGYHMKDISDTKKVSERALATSNLRKIQSTVSSMADHNSTGISAGENLWLMSVLDSEKYMTNFVLPVTENDKGITSRTLLTNANALPKTIASTLINTDDIPIMTIQDNYSTGNVNNHIGVLDWVIDDTSGWGIWHNNNKDGSITRGSIYDGHGLLLPYQFGNGNANGIKYFSNNSFVSPFLDTYTVADIINIAFIWDIYYLNNSPMNTHAELKTVTQDKFYAPKSEEDEESTKEPSETTTTTSSNNSTTNTEPNSNNTNTSDKPEIMLTPYNITSESNDNNLFYTRNYLESNSLKDYNIFNSSNQLESSSVSANIPVYSAHYNVPLLMISTYKNGYGDNLKRWVEALEDEGSEARYMMDLISQFMKKPITGVSNFIISGGQYSHSLLSTSMPQSIFSVNGIVEKLINSSFLKYYLIVETIIFIILIIRSIVHYMMNRKDNLGKELLRLVAMLCVPLMLLVTFGKCISDLNSYMLTDLSNKIVMTDLEYTLNPTPKIAYGTDEDILLEGASYETETIKDITLNLTTRDNETTPVSIYDLYSSIMFNGSVTNRIIPEKTYKLWYRSDKFVPVNHERYSTSIFYYFYDYLRYQYMGYSHIKGINDYSVNNSVDVNNIDSYLNSLVDTESAYMKQKNIFAQMYLDSGYTHINDGVADILGISNLFNCTDESGLLLDMLDENKSLEDNIDLHLTYYKQLDLNQYPEIQLWLIPFLYNKIHFECYSDVLKNTNTYIGNMHNWKFNPWDIPKDSNRVPYRLYGSLSQLKQADDKTEYTDLEVKFNSINENTLKSIYKLLNVYGENVITDDIYIFVTALHATFEFNRIIGNDISPIMIDSKTLTLDKLIKAMYTNDIKLATEDDNVIYMVYREYGFFCAIFLVINEIVLCITMLAMQVLYLGLFIAVSVSSLTANKHKFFTMFKNVGLYLLIEIFYQMVINLVLIFTDDIIELSNNAIAVTLVTLVSLVVDCAVAYALYKLLKKLATNLTSYGGTAVADMAKSIIDSFNALTYNIKHDIFKIRGMKLNSTIKVYDKDGRKMEMSKEQYRRIIIATKRRENIKNGDDLYNTER